MPQERYPRNLRPSARHQPDLPALWTPESGEPRKPSELPMPELQMGRTRRSLGFHHHPQPRLCPHHGTYPRIHPRCGSSPHRVAGTAIRPGSARIADPSSKHAPAEAQREEAVEVPEGETVRVRGAKPDYPGPRYQQVASWGNAPKEQLRPIPGNRASPRCTNTSAMKHSATLYNVVERITA